jgi:photosystem II stability/assembly factor-like uncharacterized protein
MGLSGGVEQVIVSPTDPDLIYARLYNGLMRSMDGGVTWDDIAVPAWNGVRRIAIAPNAPDTIVVTSRIGVHRSTDAGNSWEDIHPATEVWAVAVSPADPDEIVIATSIISKTMDGGQTWKTLTTPLPDNYPYMHIAIAPSAPHIIIASPWNTSILKPRKSTDGGETWNEMTSAPNNINSVDFDPQSSHIVYLTTWNLGWKSTDGGSSWQPLANGLEPWAFDFVIDPSNTQILHAADGEAGVMESLDGGASWTPINNGIQGLTVECIAIGSREPLKIYACVKGGGLWEMTRTDVQDYSISINDGDLYTNQTAVQLSLTAPPGTTEMLVSNDGGFAGATWEPFQAQRSWTITEYGANPIPRVVYAKFKTNGLTSGLYQDDIVLDVSPPTGSVILTDTVEGAVSLAYGKTEAMIPAPSKIMSHTVLLPISMRNYRPGYVYVGLTLSAVDDLSGVSEMLISDQADFAGAEWEAYVPETNRWLRDDGGATVYVKYRDRAGNESQVYSDTGAR